MRKARWISLGLVVCVLTMCGRAVNSEYSWQKPHAKVIESGDLEWQPEPFGFERGPSVRYIDFKSGDDAAAGTSKGTAWKHHPWDPAATGRAARCAGTHTYVFKRGVVYRGTLVGEEAGDPGRPIRLTSDPSWGEGEAVICGSEVVTNWERGADHEDIPEADKVYVAEVDYLPRRLWTVDGGGEITRLKLARTPNWEVSNPDDVLSEWWRWRKGGSGPNPDDPDEKRILGKDPDHINRPREYYEDAICWTEYGFVMSTPIPARVEGVDPETGTLAFKGIWYGTGGRAQQVSGGQRYYLEDKPHYLDQAGEFWVEKLGDSRARIYLRLPGDADPNRVQVEAAKRFNLVESTWLENVDISGLTFRFNNRQWDITLSWFFYKDTVTSGISLQGSARNLNIHHCTFEHLFNGITAEAPNTTDRIEALTIADNDLQEIDNKGIVVTRGNNTQGKGPFLTELSILRNRLYRVGMRTERTSNAASVHVGYAETAHIAGNVLYRGYGPGIFVFGGKRSGAEGEAPLSRILIHHNKVTDPLLAANDWGGIETWQGGPYYVWSNISGNPGGLHMWGRRKELRGNARFGHAYYLDGSFKNYLFNNLAWGKSNELESPLANTAAIQGIIGYQNTFLNNTIYNFVQGSRQQAPSAGRNKHLGNIFQDISKIVFYYARPRGKEAADPNEAHVGEDKGEYAYPTMAWAGNVFYDVAGNLGAFEETGAWYDTVESFSKALDLRGTLSPDAGKTADSPPLRDAQHHDFRPAEDSAAIDYGVRTFVPWSLYATVAEWPFTINRQDPAKVIDEHWYMTRYFRDRKGYKDQPMYPLDGTNIGAKDYVDGPLENWTRGALKLNGRDQYLTLEHARTVEPVSYSKKVKVPGWMTATYPEAVHPGETLEVKVELGQPALGRKIMVQLGYVVPGMWGGVISVTDPKLIEDSGPYEFHIKAKEREELRRYVASVFISPTDDPEARIATANLPIDVAEEGEEPAMQTKTINSHSTSVELSGPDIKSPQIYRSNFLIEAYLKVEPGSSGVLLQKFQEAGYAVKIDDRGHVVFLAGKGEDHNLGRIRSSAPIADGEWHHVIAEADRSSRRLRLYMDGQPDAFGHGVVSMMDIQNEGDVYVGGTPEGENLAVTLEFLRICQSTLADSRTTIDEMYTWQFDGPQYRDFAGRKPVGPRDAGALELAR